MRPRMLHDVSSSIGMRYIANKSGQLYTIPEWTATETSYVTKGGGMCWIVGSLARCCSSVWMFGTSCEKQKPEICERDRMRINEERIKTIKAKFIYRARIAWLWLFWLRHSIEFFLPILFQTHTEQTFNSIYLFEYNIDWVIDFMSKFGGSCFQLN